MNTRYLTLFISLAFIGFSFSAFAGKPNCAVDNTHPSCTPDPDGAIVYTAKLFGAFVFDVDVTPSPKGLGFRSNTDLNMVPQDGLLATWNHVFNGCPELVAENSVGSFFVGEDDWTIESPGGVRVIFRDIILGDAELTVQLIGNEYDFIEPFVPVPGPTSGDFYENTYVLDHVGGWGSTLKGISPRKTCKPPGGGGSGRLDFDLGYFSGEEFVATPVTLVIKATRQ
jgi:hypothetical protein